MVINMSLTDIERILMEKKLSQDTIILVYNLMLLIKASLKKNSTYIDGIELCKVIENSLRTEVK